MHAPKIALNEIPSSSSEDEWEVVPRKPGWKIHQHAEFGSRMSRGQKDTVSSDTLDECLGRVNSLKERLAEILEREGFWERYGEKLKTAGKLRAYGIGSFTEFNSSLFQFCFLLILQERYGLGKDAEFYEPQLCDLDIAVLNRLSFDINPASSSCSERVLCFMPHCDKAVYQQVIYDLLQQQGQFSLISNILSAYEIHDETWTRTNELFEEEPIYVWRQDYERFSKTAHRKESWQFKAKFAQASDAIPFEAFNDLAIVTLNTDERAELCKLTEEMSRHWFHS